MKKNILIIILIVLVLSLGGYLVYEKMGNKVESGNKKETIKENEKVTEEKVEVVDYINKEFKIYSLKDKISSEFTSCTTNYQSLDPNYGNRNVKLPMLTGNKQGVQNFNKKIQEKYKDDIRLLEENNVISELEKYKNDNQRLTYITSSNYIINYEYNITDEYISIKITRDYGNGCAGGGTAMTSFNYNIKSDNYLTNEEFINQLGFTKEDIKNEFLNSPATEDFAKEYINKDTDTQFEDLYSVYLNDNKILVNYNGHGTEPITLTLKN